MVQNEVPWYNHTFKKIARDVGKANIKAAHKIVDPKSAQTKEERRKAENMALGINTS